MTALCMLLPGREDEKGEHEHPGIAKSGKHTHELKGFQLTGGKIILHTGLKAGEIVYLLSYNNGKNTLFWTEGGDAYGPGYSDSI